MQQDFICFPGQIHLITNDQDLVNLDLGNVRELGFDTETRPSFRKGESYKIALLQLATDTDAYLIRMHHVTQFQELKRVFEDGTILKVGAAIRDDLKKLQTAFSFTPRGFIELQQVAKVKGLKNFGLKGMTEEVLNAKLSKGSKLTNWEAKVLTEPQQRYAATDAWVGLEIYRKLKRAV